MKRPRATRKAFDESYAWLRAHWNPTNLDVPAALREHWLYERDADQAKPEGFHLAVFVFGFMQHDLISNQVPPSAERSYSGELLLSLFSRWQLKLALAEVHQRTHLRIRPLSLFAFTEDERVHVSCGEDS